LPIEAAVSIAISVLEGLSYAHEATDASGQSLELVHRDISPQNVFVTNDGQVKVLDFGIAKARTHEGRTATGVVKGKLGYIAPEQAAGESVDRRADIWSLGVVLWEALTGSRLFKGETDAGTLNLSLRGEIPSASSRRPELPVELDVVLARALQRNPALRYRTAAAMHRDLQSWQRSYGNAAGRVALGDLMRELFPAELLEQRRMVSVLMARSDCTAPPPISTRSPSSTSALIIRNNTNAPADMSELSQQMRAMGKRHQRALRAIAAGLAVLAALGGAVAYFTLARLDRSAARAPAKALELPATQPAAARVLAGTARTTGSATELATKPPPVAQAAALLPRAIAPLKRAAVATRVTPEKSGNEPAPAPAALVGSKPEASSAGFLTIDTSPWSQVSLAGKSLGQTPLVGVKLPSGSQVLTLRNPELGIETSYTVQIDAGKTTVRRIGIE
jgi:serine/threonine-protein kinase